MRLSARLTGLLLAAVFAINIYRAATQGITVDEAFTYQNFVAPPLSQVMTTYDVNHHVLYSLLAKITTSLFGLSALTLRMPSLLGGLIYLVAGRVMVLRVFSPAWSLMAFALLSLNPFVLDYLSAARGYGMALGFLMWALWFLLHRSWYRAGICLGLTACANLSFLYPIAGFLGAMALVDATKKNIGLLLERVAVPLVVLPFVLYVVPVSHADVKQFEFTLPTLLESFQGFIELTFGRKYAAFTPWAALAAEILGIGVLAAGAVAFAAVLRNKPWTLLDRLILLNSGGMILCLAATWLAHVSIRAGYPYTRTGVYWPVLLTLGGVALIDRFGRLPVLRWPAWALAFLCLAGFLYEFEVGYYGEWKFDAGSKRIADLILRMGDHRPVRIACDGLLSHGLNFYGNFINHAQWDVVADPKADGDFHVLLPDDFRPDLTLIYRDPVSNAVVMK